MAGGTLDMQGLQQLIKTLAVLGHINGIAGGADNMYAVVLQELGQVDGGLTAEGDDDPDGMLRLDDVHHVLLAEGLEIEAVGGVVVCRYGFGIVVDRYNLVSEAAQRADAADAGVVEFNALTDPYRP